MTGLKNISPKNKKTSALFFQLNIQKSVSIIYTEINIGNPKESRLNHGKVFGGT